MKSTTNFFQSIFNLHRHLHRLAKQAGRVSNKKSYSSFWLMFKNACANLIQTYHGNGHSLKDGKNHTRAFFKATTSFVAKGA